VGVESQAEEEKISEFRNFEEPQATTSRQMILGPNLTPVRNSLLPNQTPGMLHF